MSPRCLPPSLGSILLTVREQTWFENFENDHRAGHLEYRNAISYFAISNLYVTPMLPVKFQLYPIHRLEGDAVWRFSKLPIWLLSWILEQNDFSHSKSPCGTNASHQVLAQSDLGLCYFVLVFFSAFSIAVTSLGEEMVNLITFRTYVRFVLVWFYWFPLPLGFWEGLRSVIVALLGLFSYFFWEEMSFDKFQDGRGTILAILNLYRSGAFHQVSAQSAIGRCCLKNFKAAIGGHLGYRNAPILAILNLNVATTPPIKFQLNPTYRPGGDVENVKS